MVILCAYFQLPAARRSSWPALRSASKKPRAKRLIAAGCKQGTQVNIVQTKPAHWHENRWNQLVLGLIAMMAISKSAICLDAVYRSAQ